MFVGWVEGLRNPSVVGEAADLAKRFADRLPVCIFCKTPVVGRGRIATSYLPEIPAVFYRTAEGAEPVLDWIRILPAEDRRVIGADLATVEGIQEVAKAEAVRRVVAWQLGNEMKRQGMTKAALAERMHTSRAQVDRILKAKGNITIETLQRAASFVGRELRIELV
jgi:hypothetical protein